MSRVHAKPLAAAIGCGVALLAPAGALAGSGGAGLPGGSPSGNPSTSGGQVQQANRPEIATGDGITVRTVESGVLTWRTRFSGKAPAADAGRVLEIERTSSPGSSSWVVAASAKITKKGGFSVLWRANRAGRLAFRAVLRTTGEAGAAAASPELNVTVYRLSRATWYGPGFYGQKTACGKKLRRNTLGVANRTLKCGSKVSILYDGRSITVPVIDRGPYGNGADWDLTAATAKALGMRGTSRVGTLF